MPSGQNGRGPLGALAHPTRVRIVEACTEWGSLSPVEIVKRGLCADLAGMKGKSPNAQLSHIDYHCRELEKAGLLALDGERGVRGATEHFYTASREARFSDDEWAELHQKEREDISQVVWHRKVAQVESAMHARTFDSRIDRMLAWGPMTLDESGWSEIASLLAGSFHEIEQIKADAERRLQEPGAQAVRCNYGLFLYEVPNRAANQ
jgi:hypothetical protein